MKGTQIKSTLTALFLLLVLPLGLYADSLTEKLEQIKSINNIRPLKSSKFKEKYLVNFNHPVDYKDSSAGPPPSSSLEPRQSLLQTTV